MLQETARTNTQKGAHICAVSFCHPCGYLRYPLECVVASCNSSVYTNTTHSAEPTSAPFKLNLPCQATVQLNVKLPLFVSLLSIFFLSLMLKRLARFISLSFIHLYSSCLTSDTGSIQTDGGQMRETSTSLRFIECQAILLSGPLAATHRLIAGRRLNDAVVHCGFCGAPSHPFFRRALWRLRIPHPHALCQ